MGFNPLFIIAVKNRRLDDFNVIFSVERGDGYEVEFEYENGEIRNLTCTCFCSYNCKHEFASVLQLRETLELIEKHYAEEYEKNGYFAAIAKGTLFALAIDGKETGSYPL